MTDDEKPGSPPMPDGQNPPAVTGEPIESEPVKTNEPESSIAQQSNSQTDELENETDKSKKDEIDPDKITEKKQEHPPEAEKRTLKQKIKHALSSWWHNPKLRNLTLAGVAALLFILLAIPPSRYFLLNTSGIRASASVVILDDSTEQPLKNVQVSLGTQTALSDVNGVATLKHIKLGSSQLVVQKSAFATTTKKYIVGWGSNPMGNISIRPVGTQYAFTISDFLSSKPIDKGEADLNEASAQSDEQGKLLLTIDKPGDQPLSIVVSAKGYRNETVTVNPEDKSNHNVKLVPNRKEVFISKRSGKYDMYTIDLDGKNEKLLLPGTGSEQDGMVLAPHPTDEVAALVSTRDNARNSDGFLFSTLNIIDLKSAEVTKVTQSERVQLVNWFGDKIVYVQITSGTSANNPKRERLMAYDYQKKESKELFATNYFNDVLFAGDQIYFAASTSYQNPSNIGLFRINPDGSNRATILNQEVWNIFRTGYSDLSLSVGQTWYTHHIGSSNASKANGPPAELKTRVYLDSPDAKNSLWADNRDGKGVLLLYDPSNNADKTLHTQSGVQYPLRWINDTTVIYRIHTDQETADYAMSTEGGNPVKIRDVTNTNGIYSWYYY